jgi:hypothetical protein
LKTILPRLDATPGSFYCDGTNVYLHPFSNTVPSSDGFIYTRSRNRGGPNTPGLSAVNAAASNLWVDGLCISKTCLASRYDNDPGNGSSAFTFAQWQAAGFDSGSVSTCDVRLNPITEAPYSDSILRKVGAQQGPVTDFTGLLHRNRRTAGAIELEEKGNFTGFQ